MNFSGCRIDRSTAANLPPAETNPVAYKMVIPNSRGKEYFLLENRQKLGFDISLGRYNVHGLAVYHVDDTVFTRKDRRAKGCSAAIRETSRRNQKIFASLSRKV